MRYSLSRHPIDRGDAGYTIIEVLIAIAIFSIGIMAMGALQSASLMSTGDIARKTMAWSLLDQRAEQLKSLRFYQTVAGMDYDDDGTTDAATAFPADLMVGGHNVATADGIFNVNWLVVDNQPVAQQNSADLPFSDLNSGNYTVSKTITVWVTRTGSVAQADALAISEFVKVWVGDGVEG